jgi:hypothetical protein
MKSLIKILCPNPTHAKFGHDKILCLYKDNEHKPPTKFWFHCGGKCRKWIQVAFNSDGAPQIEIMPEDVKFYDLEKIPVFVVRNDKHNK